MRRERARERFERLVALRPRDHVQGVLERPSLNTVPSSTLAVNLSSSRPTPTSAGVSSTSTAP